MRNNIQYSPMLSIWQTNKCRGFFSGTCNFDKKVGFFSHSISPLSCKNGKVPAQLQWWYEIEKEKEKGKKGKALF